jgi:hypothetical protein
MIAVFYTGDVRHNQEFTRQNHARLIERLGGIAPVQVYDFTRGDPDRGQCPYDPPPDIDDPDNNYRRGQGGAVQVWDFMRAVQRTTEPVIVRLRTDLWFTPSSIDVTVDAVRQVFDQRLGIAYLGSDWVNEGTAGVVDQRITLHDSDPHVQDFVVAAQRICLRDFDSVIQKIESISPGKRRSGNKMFRFIYNQPRSFEIQRILCQIWLVRQTYSVMPDDDLVCRDYLQSYIHDDKNPGSKKHLQGVSPMQTAVDWWRAHRGWPPKKIDCRQWKGWQSP